MGRKNVRTGLDLLRSDHFSRLCNRRLGVLMHAASVASNLTHLSELICQANLDVRFFMGPEHGINGVEQDMVGVTSQNDSIHGIPVISLYGTNQESLEIPQGVLDDIDVLLVDLQDIGSRCYTYASTLQYCMKKCAQAGVAVVVLDRPNPINGMNMEGPSIQDGFRTFVGAFPVPVRHGLTIGELAMVAKSEGIDVDLEVLKLQGWNRQWWFDQTDLPWVMPSPNIPTLDAATVYPGSCLVEATNLSEGRGTTRPFEIVGAPWLDSQQLVKDLSQGPIEGVVYRPVQFRPTFQKHQEQICNGFQVHVKDRSVFKPVLFGICFIIAAKKQAPERFAWRTKAYEFENDLAAIDMLTGGSEVRLMIDQGAPMSEFEFFSKKGIGDFEEWRQQFLLYSEKEEE